MTSNELSSSHAGGAQDTSATKSTVGSLPEYADILMASDKSKGGRPYFFNDKENEKVLNIAMAVATEVAVVRERLDTIERLLEAKGVLAISDIEKFKPTPEQAHERQLWHARYAARVLRIMKQELDAINQPENNKDMHVIADEINEM